MRYITAFFMAWGNFFAVPCPYKMWDNSLRRLQLVFFPMIGLLMGMLWYGVVLALEWLSVPTQLQAAALALYPFVISGFIHLDGFMDCCDAILSRRELEERQRILKDSHVGAFAVICVGILFLLSYGAAEAVMESENLHKLLKALIFIPFASRICSAFGVLNFLPIGHSQYNASYDKNINRSYGMVLAAMLIVIWGTLLYTGQRDIIYAITVVVAVHFIMMAHGRKQLGGMSGDIAGYALTISECTGILLLAVLT